MGSGDVGETNFGLDMKSSLGLGVLKFGGFKIQDMGQAYF